MRSAVIDHVLEKLIQARLVRLAPGITQEDEQIELIHESLIHNWCHYQRWLEEEELKRYRRWRLAKDAQDWEIQGKPIDLLLQGRRLQEVQAFMNLNQLEHEFIQESKKVAETFHNQEQEQKQQLKLLENELEAAKKRENVQKLKLQALETELQQAKLRQSSQVSRLKELENTTTQLVVQKRYSQRDRHFAILCLVLAIAATGIAIFENQRATQLEIRQVN